MTFSMYNDDSYIVSIQFVPMLVFHTHAV